MKKPKKEFHGEFFTPIQFAKKGLEYIEKIIGKNWWATGEYRLWDMAAGTGNLEYYLPQDALKYCYLSTLYKEDVEHCQKLFSEATIFQYDYLNDDVENIFANGSIHYEYDWKLPKNLKNDLANKNIKWIILINPPFATSQTAGANSKSKTGVSDTKIRKIMHREDLGEVSRELFSQFLYRIKYEFKEKKAYLGLFSKIKYLNANNDEKLREKIFKYSFENGFIFSSANFSGTSKNNSFPVGFLLWNLKKEDKLDAQNIDVDVFDSFFQKIDKKNIKIETKDKHLSKWIKRPAATQIFPPFSSAINIKAHNKDVRNRVAKHFLASLMCAGNNFQCQNQTALLSGPSVSAGAFSVTPDNFEKAMVIHAVRRIPKATWLNDRDQFMQPNQDISQEFITDCVVWNLFSNSNATAALKDVKYENEIYQIKNHFFPFDIEDIKKWKITDSDIFNSLMTAQNTFMYEWLEKQKKQNLISIESQNILSKAKEIYQLFFANLAQMRTPKFKIHTFDAGWWQIKNAMNDVNIGENELKELKNLHDILKKKLLPQIKKYQFF